MDMVIGADGDSSVCERCGGTGWIVIGEDAYHCDCHSGMRLNQLEREPNIPARYSHCSFLNFKSDNNTSLQRGLEVAKDFVNMYPANRDGLLFMGGCGVGKTHLAVGIIEEIIATKGASCLFIDFRSLLEEIKETFQTSSEGPSEMDILGPVLETDVIILDDLGAEKTSEWVLDRLGFIINHRYNHQKTMKITTNFLDPKNEKSNLERATETLESRIGVRLRSRLYEMCKLVEIDAEDFRKKTAKKRATSRSGRPRNRAY